MIIRLKDGRTVSKMNFFGIVFDLKTMDGMLVEKGGVKMPFEKAIYIYCVENGIDVDCVEKEGVV